MTISAQQFNKIALKDDIIRLEDQIKEINKKISQIFDLFDGFGYKTHNFECDFAANQSAHDRFEGRLNRIEDNLELAPLFDY
jgi:uncharacterized protein (UPF0335 family)